MSTPSEITFYSNTLAYLLANLKPLQRGLATDTNVLIWKDAAGTAYMCAIQKYYYGGAWLDYNNSFGNISANIVTAQGGLKDDNLAVAVPISETDVAGLIGFTAESIVGCLNELKANSSLVIDDGVNPRWKFMPVGDKLCLYKDAARDDNYVDTGTYWE